MKITLVDHQVIEHEFAVNLYLFLKYFNMLEFNISRCIARMHDYNNPEVLYPELSKFTMHKKMNALNKLVLKKKSDSNEEIVIEFRKWFEKASELRLVRNDFVHGHWDILLDKEKPILFVSSELETKTKKRDLLQMSVDQFLGNVRELESVFKEFVGLKDRLERISCF